MNSPKDKLDNLPDPFTNKMENPKVRWSEYFENDNGIRVVYLILGFILISGVLTFLQTRTDAICCGDVDGYYHIKWASLIWENFKHGKWLPTFEWLPLTVLNPHDYADHHFLFHLLQIPFLWFFVPVTAAKVAAVFYATLAVFSIYWMMFRYGVDYLLVWLAVLLTCSGPFFYRMSMAKAPPLTIIITVTGIYLLFERKYIWLLPLMFAFVWTYSLFPILFVAAIIWTIVLFWNDRRFEWRPICYTTVGMILGIVINPYFPKNVYLFYEHVVEKFNTGANFVVDVGLEWYPYDSITLIRALPIALICMLIGYVLFALRLKKMPKRAEFLFAFTTVLLIAQLRSRRFIEYFPPFAILFASVAWAEFQQPKLDDLPAESDWDNERALASDKLSRASGLSEPVRRAIPLAIGLLLVAVWFVTLIGFHNFGVNEGGMMDIEFNIKNARYRNAMEWATGHDKSGAENIPAGELIFNTSWDDFPQLFFYDTKHTYVYGLDPNYLYTQNPELYKLLKDIVQGKVNDAAPLIRDKFGSNYIFFNDEKVNLDMAVKLYKSGWVETVYRDTDGRFLKIRPQKGEPPVLENEELPKSDDGK